MAAVDGTALPGAERSLKADEVGAEDDEDDQEDDNKEEVAKDNPCPVRPDVVAGKAADTADRTAALEAQVAELERTVTELRRQTLLPCKLCAGGREAREWGTLADTLLLVQPLWQRAKAARLPALRPLEDNLQLEPLELVAKSNALAGELCGLLDRCERLQGAAAEADSSLFSLFPFSAGTFQRAAWHQVANADSAPNEERHRRLHADRELATGEASRVLVEMTRALLEQQLETNGYLEELVERTVVKEEALRSQLGCAPTGTQVDEHAAEDALDGALLLEQAIEEDAAEVEL